MMPNYHIGIDPGKTGYIAAIDGDGAVAWTWTLKDRTHRDIIDLLSAHADCPVMIERQYAMRGQGLSSTFTIGFGYGVLTGIVESLGMPLHLCRAQDWQRVMLAGADMDAVQRADERARRWEKMDMLERLTADQAIALDTADQAIAKYRRGLQQLGVEV